ncbi:MAG: thiamine-phosphate kinase [Verrucomicrobiota bacterium]|nr:thiamine-phosphate kinase [Verrucomicrobiota bacterium]
MFTKNTDESIRALAEVALIAQIRHWLGAVAPSCPQGIGDDCAVVDWPKGLKQVLTTDSLSYGQHFDDSVSAHDAGAKLIKRNLSDIAAMGGRPGEALLNLLSGNDLQTDWLAAFFDGICDACQEYDLPIVGGDISTLPNGQFTAVLSLTGYSEKTPLLRKGAQAGDALYVTGTLGGSILNKHYNFKPRLTEGQWLAHSMACSALMDTTDGLAKDLSELIPDGCAAYLKLSEIPLSDAAHQCANASGQSAIEHAFCDGEDYELLFAVKNNTKLEIFESHWRQKFPDTPLSQIGRIRKSKSKAPYIDSQTNEALPWVKGFEHLIDP